jgi:hypothetical protein
MTGGEAGRKEALSPTAVTMFATINQWVEITSQEPPEVEPKSPLAGDARNSESLQVAHAAWAGIVHSIDHLHALRALLIQAQVLNLGAPYTLARSAMENAATAVWLLEPAQRLERLRRRLKLAHHEAWEEGELHKLLPAKALKGKRSAQERMAAIRALAVQGGLDASAVAGRFSYEKVIKAAAKTTLREDDKPDPDKLSSEELAAVMWRLCSGFAHGRTWASMSWLERQVVRTEAGVHTLQLTGGEIQRVVTVALLPCAFTTRALQLYEQRRRSPYT